MNKRQITLADLAKELGISTATVSRALKDYPDISRETKRRVLELAKKLNYRPNSMAAGLRKRESKIIGVIIPSIVNHFFSAVIQGIMDVAYKAGYRVMLCQSGESYEKEVADADALFSSRVDGVMVSIAHGTEDIDHLLAFQHAGIPIVFFDKIPKESVNASTVVVDDYEGAYQVVSHLIGQGCQRIAHFRGPMLASTSRARYKAYVDALNDHQIQLDESIICDCHNITLEEGHDYAMQCLSQSKPCDAIFAITDMVAIGALTACHELGFKIPQDVAIAGFSDWQMSSVIEPKLTSVAQPSHALGKKATQLLLKEIGAVKNEQTFEYEQIILKTRLKVRDSSNLKGMLMKKS